MLEYKRSLKAKKIPVDKLPEELKNQIQKLADLEQSIIEAETAKNDELVNELDSQFATLDGEIADKIDDFELPKPTPTPTPNPNPNPNPNPEPKEGGSNTGLVIGILGIVGLGIAYFFGVKGKK